MVFLHRTALQPAVVNVSVSEYSPVGGQKSRVLVASLLGATQGSPWPLLPEVTQALSPGSHSSALAHESVAESALVWQISAAL